jgi:outer membrane protein assembly factor BamB
MARALAQLQLGAAYLLWISQCCTVRKKALFTASVAAYSSIVVNRVSGLRCALVSCIALASCDSKPAPSTASQLAEQPLSGTGAVAAEGGAPAAGTSATAQGTAGPAASGGVAGRAGNAAQMPTASAGKSAGPTSAAMQPEAGANAIPMDPGVPPEVAAHAEDWPLPNWNYDNTRSPKTRIDSSNIASLHEAWRYKIEISDLTGNYFVTSNPLILGDTIYFQDMMSNVHALDRAKGTLRWKRAFSQATFGPNGIAVGHGKLFGIAGDSDVVALNLADGKDVWKFTPTFTHSEGMDVQPVVYDGTLFVASVPASTTRGVYEGGSHGELIAVDAESGKQRWSFDTIESKTTLMTDPDAYGGGGAWYPPLIDSKRGLTYWGTGNPVPWPLTPDPSNRGTRAGSPNLYTCSVVALDLKDGAYRWHYQDQPTDIFDWDFQITPLLARAASPSGEDLLIGAGKTGAVVALDPQTGKLLWRTKVGKHMNDELSEYPQQSITIYPGVLGGVMSALAYADGVVYVPSVDLALNYDGALLIPGVTGGTGTLTAIQVSDGKVLWTAPIRSACYGAATIANDLVLTSDENGRVYAFARETGKEMWHFDAPGGGINAPIVVTGDTLLIPIGVNTGTLLAMSLDATGSSSGAGGTGGSSGAAGSGGSGEPTFTGVFRDVLQRSGCSGSPTCHASAVAGELVMTNAAATYAALVGVKAMGSGSGATGCSASGLTRVVPGDPDGSLLVQKLESASPPCGAHMPPGGMLAPALIQQLRTWIANGAKND